MTFKLRMAEIALLIQHICPYINQKFMYLVIQSLYFIFYRINKVGCWYESLFYLLATFMELIEFYNDSIKL